MVLSDLMRTPSIISLTLLVASSAQAQFLPPPEFDKPYEGRLYYEIAPNQDYVRKVCPSFKNPGPALACTICFAGICVIVMVSDEEIRAAGHDPEIVRRHERGHANGWPADHHGAR
jgi:hypothetical protein